MGAWKGALWRAGRAVGTAIFWLWAGMLFMSNWIGRSTIADDTQYAGGLAVKAVEWLLSTPWYAPVILATLLTVLLAWPQMPALVWRFFQSEELRSVSTRRETLPLPPEPAKSPVSAAAKQKGEAAHHFESSEAYNALTDFIAGHLLPTCAEQELLQRFLISYFCANKEIAHLASAGMRSDPEQTAFLDTLSKVEDELGQSPPIVVPLAEAIENVAIIERGYAEWCARVDKICETPAKKIEFLSTDLGNKYFENWRRRHNEMVQAYESIKCDVRLGKLFRPLRPSRWGGIVPPLGVSSAPPN